MLLPLIPVLGQPNQAGVNIENRVHFSIPQGCTVTQYSNNLRFLDRCGFSNVPVIPLKSFYQNTFVVCPMSSHAPNLWNPGN